MSQPLDQDADHSPPGPVDKSTGEFWMRNPWHTGDENLSAYERNQVALNLGGQGFLDVSHLTGADSDSDSRGVAAGDFNNDGMPDLIVRSSGGGPIRLFQNRWPQTSWLRLSLRGHQSNSRGIGARIRVECGGQTQWRELFPECSFVAQSPAEVHFGLGTTTKIDRITVFWPSGIEQQFEDVPASQHLIIDEHSDFPSTISESIASPGTSRQVKAD